LSLYLLLAFIMPLVNNFHQSIYKLLFYNDVELMMLNNAKI